MRRSLATVAVLALLGVMTLSQQLPPGAYPPRQPYPPRGYPPYWNPALSNYYFQNQQRFLAPGTVPPNYWPGMRFGSTGVFMTNFGQGNPFAPYPFASSNYPPGNRFAPNPYSFTNVFPQVGFATNRSPFAPVGTNLPDYTFSATNFPATNALNNSANFSPPSATTNFLQPNSTNTSSRLAITPAQRMNINRLTAVLHAIKTSPISSTQRQQLLSALRVSAQGSARPSDKTVTKFVDDFVSAWPENGFTYQQKFQLSVDLVRVLNSGNLTPGEAFVVVNDARRVSQTASVKDEPLNTLVDDLNAIVAEVQKTPPKESAAASDPQKAP